MPRYDARRVDYRAFDFVRIFAERERAQHPAAWAAFSGVGPQEWLTAERSMDEWEEIWRAFRVGFAACLAEAPA